MPGGSNLSFFCHTGPNQAQPHTGCSNTVFPTGAFCWGWLCSAGQGSPRAPAVSCDSSSGGLQPAPSSLPQLLLHCMGPNSYITLNPSIQTKWISSPSLFSWLLLFVHFETNLLSFSSDFLLLETFSPGLSCSPCLCISL